MKSRKKILLIIVIIAAVAAAALILMHNTARKEYKITVSGISTGPGVVSFLGYDINVYKDKASNSCGDCTQQPVHLYQGADAHAVIQAISRAVKRADDVWEVKKVDSRSICLQEKKSGTADQRNFDKLDAPPGITIKDNYGHKYTGKAAASDQSDKKNILDIDGDKIEVPVSVKKIGAVYGPAYEALYVLGQSKKVVVCSDVQKEDFPWATEIFSGLGSTPCLKNVHSSVNVEKPMTYKPDIVFTFNRPGELKQLKEGGVCAVPGKTTEKLKDVPDELLVYAHATGGGAVKKAEAYKKYFNEKYSYVKSKTKGLKESEKPSVYYAGIKLLTTYGRYSDIPDLIETAGGRAVTRDIDAGNHTQIDFEQLAAWNPDYIFLDHGGMNEGKALEELRKDIYSQDRYKDISAVKNKKVYLSPTGVFYWDMGLQKILLLMNVSKTIHPELFSDLDMEKEVMTFYKKFYGYDLTKKQARMILTRQDP